jgi:DNA-binding Lrp family transcriptional regulator
VVTAIVLINVQHGLINEVAERLVEVDGVSEVFSVGGRYDLVALLRVRSNDELAELVTRRLLKVDGIERSETLIAFQAHSRHDLERMFGL